MVELRFDWLEKIHAYLKENDALLGDVDTVAMLIEQYQVGVGGKEGLKVEVVCWKSLCMI